MTDSTKEVITDNKFVELTYKVLAPAVMRELDGKAQGDIIEVPIDCNELYGPRDEDLVITDLLDNVPEEYREVGTAILMENDKGQTKTFLVTRIDKKTITFDGNNPLCGREVIFRLEILKVRDATDEEMEAGGSIERAPNLGDSMVKLD